MDLPLDVQRYICIFLSDEELEKVPWPFYNNRNDVFWKMKYQEFTNKAPPTLDQKLLYEIVKSLDYEPHRVYEKLGILHIYIRERSWPDIYRQLIDNETFLKENINDISNNDTTLLYYLCTDYPGSRNLVLLIQKLIDHGADVNACRPKVIMSKFVLDRDVTKMKIFLKAGVNINSADTSPSTYNISLLSLAKQINNHEIIELLKCYGAQ